MAKAKNIVFSGKLYYAMVYEGNHDEYGGKEFYKTTIALDNPSWDKFNKSGLSLKVRELDGEDVVTFKRDIHAKTGIDKKGKKWSLGGGPPRVVDEFGDEFSELIGNGSKAEILVEVYEVSSGPMKGKKGHRLEAIKILEHIPYEPNDDEDDEESEVENTQEETETVDKGSKASKTKGLPF